MSSVPAIQEQQGLASRHELSVDEVVAQVEKIHEVTKRAMQEGTHYGTVPGTQKPTLLKAGAEKLCLTFRLDPQYASTEERDGRHLTVKSVCTLWHIPTGQRMGSGEGSCSTQESKYAYRQAKRKCPACEAEAIVKSRYPPRDRRDEVPGWWCAPKGGGCGADFSANDPAIVDQQTGRTDNPDLPDTYNTVLKMANKRALVAAVLNVTAASDIFTQDMEDFAGGDTGAGEQPGERTSADRPQGRRELEPSRSAAPPTETVLIDAGRQKMLRAVIRGSGWGKTEQDQETALHDLLAARQVNRVEEIPVEKFEEILNAAKLGPKKG
jgi:hypothetical protein